MGLLTYIRKVLEIYVGGDQDHLSQSLFRDVGPEPTSYDEIVHSLISNVEEQGILIAQLLAGGRMDAGPDFVDPQTEELLIAQQRKNIESLANVWIEPASLQGSVPTKSDLIEIGIMYFVLDRLESGNDRISKLDLLSIILPGRLTNLQTMFSEAHFNYLLGNRTAVTIICRALLEEALRDKVPGNVTIDGDKKTLNDRLEEAKLKGLLDDERIHCAREVVKMGNLAAHNSTRLLAYPDLRIEEVLINTRKVLADLYPSEIRHPAD
jgi:hypothetical protein